MKGTQMLGSGREGKVKCLNHAGEENVMKMQYVYVPILQDDGNY